MGNDSAPKSIARCPGCRFGCRVEKIQCGRGLSLLAPSTAHQPPETCMYRPDLPPEARLSQVIPLAAERLQKALPHDPAHTVGGVLHRHGSCMTLKMLKAHAKMNSADFDLALENLQECGLVEIAPIEPLGMSARLTDAGERQLDVWRSELDEACALFASPLTREECQQLVTLLFKLVRN